MKNSLYIGSPFGIRITIHWTFILLIAFVVFINVKNGSSFTQIIISILFILAIFGCVILHELGHSLAARRYGITTRGITLLPIGGLASLTKIPEEPRRELFVAIAGPIVNVIIATIIGLILFLTGYNFGGLSYQYLNLKEFLPALLIINILLVIFNLIPAFPMDGGRLLRAGLAFKLSRVKATAIASKVGQVIAIGFAAWGIFNNPLLIIIAAFVFIGARAELQDVRSKSVLEGKMVSDILIKNSTILNPQMPLSKAVDVLLAGVENEFIVMANNTVFGILSGDDIRYGLAKYDQDIEIERIMDVNFYTFKLNDLLKDAYEKFQLSGSRIAPVYENNEFTGIISIDKINEYIRVQEILKKNI